jgi:NAD(P)H-nitrite reductase large subunit
MEQEKLALLIVSRPETILEKWVGVKENVSLLDLCRVVNGKIESRVIMINNRFDNPYRELYLSKGSKPFLEPFGEIDVDFAPNEPIQLN